jgi:hypothetical protein
MVNLPAIARQKRRRSNQWPLSDKQMEKEKTVGNLHVKGPALLASTDVHQFVVAPMSLLLLSVAVQVVPVLLLLLLSVAVQVVPVLLLLLLLLMMVRKNTSPSSAAMLRSAKTFRCKIGDIFPGLVPHPGGSVAACPLSRSQTCPSRGGARPDFCEGVPRNLRRGLEIFVCARAREGSLDGERRRKGCA